MLTRGIFFASGMALFRAWKVCDIWFMFEALEEKGFEFRYECHALAILEKDFPAAMEDLARVLAGMRIPIAEIIGSGGGEAKGTQRMRRALSEAGWLKTTFEIKKIINGVEREATSHEVDHVKDFGGKKLALEIEWNNKDPFFDRDLENFKRLHAEGAISVGIVITRGSSLHEKMGNLVLEFAKRQGIKSFEDLNRLEVQLTPRKRREIETRTQRARKPIDFQVAWRDNFVSDKYGEATTHWSKLEARISRGVGNPCPLMLVGLPASIVTFEE
jgi:hypothetical protein